METIRRIRWGAALLVLFAALDAAAAIEIVEEGFTTGLTRNRRSLNRVTRATTDDPVYHWVHVKGLPEGRKITARCIVNAPNGVPVVDEDDLWDDEEGDEGFAFCGVDGDEKSLDEGMYTFVHYINGEKLAERTIAIDKKPFWNLSLRRQFKWALGALAAVILAVFWVRKKLYGDKTIDKAFAPKEAAAAAGSTGVKIASKLAGGAATGAAPAPAPPKEPTPDDLLKAFKAKLAADPAARPARPEDVLPIAKAARASGDARTAIAAVRGFDKTNVGHTLIPDVYLFSAKVMAEDLKNVDMARKILEHLMAKYPGHYLAPEAKRYLQALPNPT